MCSGESRREQTEERNSNIAYQESNTSTRMSVEGDSSRGESGMATEAEQQALRQTVKESVRGILMEIPGFRALTEVGIPLSTIGGVAGGSSEGAAASYPGTSRLESSEGGGRPVRSPKGDETGGGGGGVRVQERDDYWACSRCRSRHRHDTSRGPGGSPVRHDASRVGAWGTPSGE